MKGKVIVQLSIFISNVPGSLAATAEVLRECGINMRACNLAESADFGILRAIVDDPEGSAAKLAERGVIARTTELVGVRISDVPGSISAPAKALGDAGINIEYGYAFTSGGTEGLLMRVDDPRRALEVLDAAGLPLVDGSEIRWATSTSRRSAPRGWPGRSGRRAPSPT